MNTSNPRARPPPEISAICGTVDPWLPVTIPNAFCPIVVGPCALAPDAAGVDADPYPGGAKTLPPSPMFKLSPAIAPPYAVAP